MEKLEITTTLFTGIEFTHWEKLLPMMGLYSLVQNHQPPSILTLFRLSILWVSHFVTLSIDRQRQAALQGSQGRLRSRKEHSCDLFPLAY